MTTEFSAQTRLIYAFPKGQGEEVQFSIKKFNQKIYGDIRIWFRSPNDHGIKPTKKGIFFLLNQTDELSRGLDRLRNLAIRVADNKFDPFSQE